MNLPSPECTGDSRRRGSKTLRLDRNLRCCGLPVVAGNVLGRGLNGSSDEFGKFGRNKLKNNRTKEGTCGISPSDGKQE